MTGLRQKAWRVAGPVLCIAGLAVLAFYGLRLCGLVLSAAIQGAGLALACAVGYAVWRLGCRLWRRPPPARPRPDVSAKTIEQELRTIKKSLGKD